MSGERPSARAVACEAAARLAAPALVVFGGAEPPFVNRPFQALAGGEAAEALDGKTLERLRGFAAAGGDAARKITAAAGGVRAGDDWTHGVFYFLPFAEGGLVIFQPGAEEPGSVDYLTGLANRREAESRLRVESARARRQSRRFCVALGDIDYFKSINDRFGHEVGDDVLCHVARALQDSLRGGDWCARWGGEEFLLFIADADAEAGMFAVERARRALQDNPPAVAGGRTAATMSFGVAASAGHQRYQDMIAEADLLLYESKRRGRNRVSVRRDSAGPALWNKERLTRLAAGDDLRAYCAPLHNAQTGDLAALFAAPFLRGDGDGALRAARMMRSAEILGMLPEVELAFLRAVRRDLAAATAPVLAPLSVKTLARNAAAAEVIRLAGGENPRLAVGASAASAGDEAALRNLRVIAAHGAEIFLDDIPLAAPPLALLAAAPFSYVLFAAGRRAADKSEEGDHAAAGGGQSAQESADSNPAVASADSKSAAAAPESAGFGGVHIPTGGAFDAARRMREMLDAAFAAVRASGAAVVVTGDSEDVPPPDLRRSAAAAVAPEEINR